MKYPDPTRCPKCGHLDATTVCRFCQVDKLAKPELDVKIPASLRSPSASLAGWPAEKPATECWECSAPLGPGKFFGPYNYCPACRAAQRQEARQIAAEERRERDEEDA